MAGVPPAVGEKCEEVLVGGRVELHWNASPVSEEQDRPGGLAVAAGRHAEIERDLVELTRGERSLVVPAFRFADDDEAGGAIAAGTSGNTDVGLQTPPGSGRVSSQETKSTAFATQGPLAEILQGPTWRRSPPIEGQNRRSFQTIIAAAGSRLPSLAPVIPVGIPV